MSEETVDCRKLAEALSAQRASANPGLASALMTRFNIDAALSLTDLEGIDIGDAVAWGDLPDLHALRYVPLSLFSPADIELMLVHRESVGVMLPMARLILEKEPLIAAQNFDGDLLLTAASCVASEAFDAPIQVPTPFEDGPPDGANWVLELIAHGENQLWADFARAADGRAESEFARARKAICWGPPLVDTPWFSPFDDVKNTLCEARAWLKPPRVLARAVANSLYIVPPDGTLQIASPERFFQFSKTAEHAFERVTVYEIITPHDTEVPGFDLVNRAVSCIEDWRGTRVPNANTGIQMAMELFGLPPALWDDCGPMDDALANHYEV